MMQYGIFFSIGLLLLGMYLLFNFVTQGIAFFSPQTVLMLMTMNNKSSAVDVSNVRFVVCTMFQTLCPYPGGNRGISIKEVSLPVRGATGLYNATFREILITVRIVSPTKAFWNAPDGKPLIWVAKTALQTMSGLLQKEDFGPRFESEGLNALTEALLPILVADTTSWGVIVSKVSIGDFDVPAWMDERQRTVAAAHAEAESFRVTKTAQGNDWYFHQMWDALVEMKNLRVLNLGGPDSMMSNIMSGIEASKEKDKDG